MRAATRPAGLLPAADSLLGAVTLARALRKNGAAESSDLPFGRPRSKPEDGRSGGVVTG